jgi:hypothetical protein
MTVICISLLGGAYANLVKDLLHYPTCVHAWMLVSRLNSKRQPVVLLLPVDPVIEGIFFFERDMEVVISQHIIHIPVLVCITS